MKTALVTGGTTRLGLAIADRLRANGWRVLLAGAGLSLGIEIAQYLLGTGYADVDDVLLNALGALAGCGLLRRLRRR